MIKHGLANYLVYSKCGKDDTGPGLYFYDLLLQKTTKRILGAEVFLDFMPNDTEDDT